MDALVATSEQARFCAAFCLLKWVAAIQEYRTIQIDNRVQHYIVTEQQTHTLYFLGAWSTAGSKSGWSARWMLITGLKRVTWNTRLGMLFSSDSKSSADGGGNCSRVGSKNKQSKLYHKNGHNISTNIYKLMTYFTQNLLYYFTTKSVNTTSTFVPLPLQCFKMFHLNVQKMINILWII